MSHTNCRQNGGTARTPRSIAPWASTTQKPSTERSPRLDLFPCSAPIVLLTWLNCSNCYIHPSDYLLPWIDRALFLSLSLFLLFGLFVHGFSRALHLVFSLPFLSVFPLASQLSAHSPALRMFVRFVGSICFDRVRFGFGMAMVCVNILQLGYVVVILGLSSTAFQLCRPIFLL